MADIFSQWIFYMFIIASFIAVTLFPQETFLL